LECHYKLHGIWVLHKTFHPDEDRHHACNYEVDVLIHDGHSLGACDDDHPDGGGEGTDQMEDDDPVEKDKLEENDLMASTQVKLPRQMVDQPVEG